MKGRERQHFAGASKGRPPILDYNQIRPADSHEAQFAKLEYWVAKQIGEDLVKHYPGRQWIVDVDARNGVVVIGCPSVSLTKGYVLHVRKDSTAPLLLRARKAAGEILERYGVSRSRKIDAQALEAAPRTVRDELIVPNRTDTAPEPMK